MLHAIHRNPELQHSSAEDENEDEEEQAAEASEAAGGADKSSQAVSPIQPNTPLTLSATMPESATASPTPGTSTASDAVLEQFLSITNFWKGYSIQSAINNLLVAWGEVTVPSINHAWRRMTPQLCATRPGDCQSAAEAAEAAMRAARTVPGCQCHPG